MGGRRDVLKLLVAGVPAAAVAVGAETLQLRVSADKLFVTAPTLALIQGPLLQHLKNGNTASFDFNLSLWAGSKNSTRRPAFERFVVSYDLWEEKFSVAGLRKPQVSASRLTAQGVPAWCLEHISVPVTGIASNAPVWAKLEVNLVEKQNKSDSEENAINLASLVEIFSNTNRGSQRRWVFETGPTKL